MVHRQAHLLRRLVLLALFTLIVNACADDGSYETASGLASDRTLGSLDEAEVALLYDFRKETDFQPSHEQTCKITAISLHEARCPEAQQECAANEDGRWSSSASTSSPSLERFTQGLARCARVTVGTYERCLQDRAESTRHLYEHSSCSDGLVFDIRTFCQALKACSTDV